MWASYALFWEFSCVFLKPFISFCSRNLTKDIRNLIKDSLMRLLL